MNTADWLILAATAAFVVVALATWIGDGSRTVGRLIVDPVDAHAATAMAALAPDDLPDFTAAEWAKWITLQAPDRTPLSTEET